MDDEQQRNDVEVYTSLLRTVLALLMNVTEMYDTGFELNSFNGFLLNKVKSDFENVFTPSPHCDISLHISSHQICRSYVPGTPKLGRKTA